jgi:hypothetical protein
MKMIYLHNDCIYVYIYIYSFHIMNAIFITVEKMNDALYKILKSIMFNVDVMSNDLLFALTERPVHSMLMKPI